MYNPEANGKVERRHRPIVKALVRACKGHVGSWSCLLPYALWAYQTTHSSVTGFMPAELMYGQKPIMPVERTISSWAAMDFLNREQLLAAQIRQVERRLEDVDQAKAKLHATRVKNKGHFD